MSATKTAPDRPIDVVEAERGDHEVQAQALRRPDQPGQEQEHRQAAQGNRAEDALLEPVVQVEDPVRRRQGVEDPASEVAHGQEANGHDADDDDTDQEHNSTAGGSPLRKLQNPAAMPRTAIAMAIEHPLDEDRAERAAQRDVAIELLLSR